MSAGPGVATSDQLLDIGSVGLRFFDVYLPLYAQLWDPGTMSLGRARQRYDEQRDLSFAQLCEDADVVAAAAQRLESEQTAMRAAARALRDAWRGAAGISVGAHVGEVLGATTRQSSTSSIQPPSCGGAPRNWSTMCGPRPTTLPPSPRC